MKTLQFKCTLLSDLIINQKAASTGPNSTLDFIPGNNFLGIVAAKYDDPEFENKLMEVFHSGKVRFGDAHPVDAKSDYRSLHVPASIFSPKLQKGIYYQHHMIEGDLKVQLEQQRRGFYDFSKNPAEKINADTTFSIKSAYDSEKRKSQDEQMFGYEALREGLELYFEVEVDDGSIATLIEKALVGVKRVGRSRSAQYGLVRIEPFSFKEIHSSENPYKPGFHTVYADGRLIFYDPEIGQLTLAPTAQMLGFTNGIIRWDLSQVQTFQYAPYNGKRRCFDPDRFGFEKGSVFVVQSDEAPIISSYIGAFRNEGFGKVIFNPSFLSDKNIILKESVDNPKQDSNDIPDESKTPLVKYLLDIQEFTECSKFITSKVNEWVKRNNKYFQDTQFASQWGEIRNRANQHRTSWRQLEESLFNSDSGYLCHGTAAKKWKEKERIGKLKQFIASLHDEAGTGMIVPQEQYWRAIANLSSEMAKKSLK